MMKSIFLTMALILAGVSAGYSKSYDLVFSSLMKTGDLTLKPGEYRLTVQGDTATFTLLQPAGFSFPVEGNTAIFTRWVTNKTYTMPVRIENGGAKNLTTEVFTRDQNDTNEIQRIALGGSATDLEFGGVR